MANLRRSNIGYCDFSGGDLNFVIGCTPVGPECEHCYARRLIQDRLGRDFSEVRFYPEKLRRLENAVFAEKGEPFRRGLGARPIAFAVDLGDLFHGRITDDQIGQAYDVMAVRTDVDWLVLTKRADRLASWTQRELTEGWPPHIWVGVTVGIKGSMSRLQQLARTQAAVKWLSVEPMLEAFAIPSDLLADLSWVCCGAESGPGRRFFNPEWAVRLYEQCAEVGVAFFGKQDTGAGPGVPLYIQGREIKQWPGESPGWIETANQMPDSHIWVYIRLYNGHEPGLASWVPDVGKAGLWCGFQRNYISTEVTHWMRRAGGP